MGVNRYAAKRDANEPEIIAVLKAAGATIVQISQEGVCDLLVGINDENYLLEVKAAKGKLTEPQEAFFATWRGQKSVVRTPEEALRAIGR